ncbi:MAG: NUDIX hydrolase, partial [Actinomycetota bacterium]
MRRWTVGGALIRHHDGLVLVGNRRRDHSLEWTPPGGVIDPGEELLAGLDREVREETGLVVSAWAGLVYCVTVEAPDMGWQLKVESWEAVSADGEVTIADPDGIVEEVRHSSAAEVPPLLASSPPWVRDP